ncbi:MAG: PDZ domain-containing protein [Cyanobacteria bacterium CRU_2_1]|nr:PDZ domain-containing protein [Cyanobacteria bacterium RU_5_0]NJR59454.1 PDZ domain-containing protein [Cyanobacteria bacterium CRU_2_1]
MVTSDEQVSPLLALSNTFAEAIAHAGQSIVAVKGGRRFGASGVHWRSGVIITSDHSLRQEDEITLVLPDQSTTTAPIIGRDPGTNLAILRLRPELNLPIATIQHPASLQVGHLVLAVGRSSETGLTASMGMISALGGTWRTWNGGQIDQFIRPDLTLYPGGSGSALIDPQGQVLGINIATPRSAVLTIPAVTIDRVVDQLLNRGRIVRGYLGVGMQPVELPQRLQQALNLSGTRVLVVSVESGSPAEQAGIMIGDVIVELGDRQISDIHDVHQMLDPEQVGKPLGVKVIRGGQWMELTVTVGERPRRAE